jgi:hypothetical protein
MKELSVEEKLKLYVERVDELLQCRFARQGMKSQYQIEWDSESQTMKYTANEPDEDDLRSFLLLFRHFLSDREPVFVGRIFNDCFRFLNNDHLKGELQKAKDDWKRLLYRAGGMEMIVDEKRLSGEYVLDLWINGHYFHNDTEKRKELSRLLGDILPLVRVKFLSSLPYLTNVIIFLAQVVNKGLEDSLFAFPAEVGK